MNGIYYFETLEEYNSNKPTTVPSFSYIAESDEVFAGEGNYIIATYNVTSTTVTTKIFNQTPSVKYVFVDGFTIGNTTGITFNELGEVKAKIFLNDDNFDFSSLFNGCKTLTSVDFTMVNTTQYYPVNMSDMFKGCFNLTTLNLASFDCTSVTSFAGMCQNCSSLTSVEFDSGTSFDSLETAANMFINCSKLENIIFPDPCETYSLTDTSSMFKNCKSITDLQTIIETLDTSSVTNMSSMFMGCQIESLDLSTFDTSSVENMSTMFQDCKQLTNLTINEWNTSLVTTMDSMFRNCSALTSLDLSGFDLTNVTDLDNTFRMCTNLTSITILGGAPSSSCSYSTMTNGIALNGTLTLNTEYAHIPDDTFKLAFKTNGWSVIAVEYSSVTNENEE